MQRTNQWLIDSFSAHIFYKHYLMGFIKLFLNVQQKSVLSLCKCFSSTASSLDPTFQVHLICHLYLKHIQIMVQGTFKAMRSRCLYKYNHHYTTNPWIMMLQTSRWQQKSDMHFWVFGREHGKNLHSFRRAFKVIHKQL